MDKHERPYKCELTGCEQLQGFTYKGGLSRHQREVHNDGATQKSSAQYSTANVELLESHEMKISTSIYAAYIVNGSIRLRLTISIVKLSNTPQRELFDRIATPTKPQ
jgi:hypothetical protein